MATREELFNARLRKLEKQQAVIELLRDPDIYDFVEGLIGEDAQPGSPLVSTNGHKASPRGKRRSTANITEAIREAGPRLPKRFKVKDLVDLLEADSFKFRRSQHNNAVRDALYFIVRQANAPYRVAEHGTAGDPNIYEYTGGASEA